MNQQVAGSGRRAVVAGGSIGGLFAAAALRRRGFEVDIVERVDVELSGRGAGIVTHDPLIDALRAVGVNVDDLGVSVDERVAFNRAGERVRAIDFPQVVTSWDRIHGLLRALVPEGRYHSGRQVSGYRSCDETVEVLFDEGASMTADILVGADGFRSAVRAQMLPEIEPQYAGYVVWRALADEASLSDTFRRAIFDTFAIFMPTGTQIIGYPIAGPGNDLRVGHRRYNFVWYVPVDAATLEEMLTDESGHRHAISIPPPLVRPSVLDAMMHDAKARLPAPFVEVLERGERPFFTPIYDHLSPSMASGRVALAGDAAAVARPHVGMGVTKAACDAIALAQHLVNAPVEGALAAYSQERVAASQIAVETARRLGRHLLEVPKQDNSDGSRHPHADEILRVTAAIPSGVPVESAA